MFPPTKLVELQSFCRCYREDIFKWCCCDGNGTFGAQQSLPGNFNQFAVGDFNHDGSSDVAYFSANTNPEDSYPFDTSLVVLLGGSNGLAATGQTIATNGSMASILVAVDLTGSGYGKPDVMKRAA
jgi:hypothetical protein